MNSPVEIELIEQLRAQLLCHRIDARSLRLGLEGLLREVRSGESNGKPSLPLTSRLQPAANRLSHMDLVQLRMIELQRRIQARLGEAQERIQSAYTVRIGAPVCAHSISKGSR